MCTCTDDGCACKNVPAQPMPQRQHPFTLTAEHFMQLRRVGWWLGADRGIDYQTGDIAVFFTSKPLFYDKDSKPVMLAYIRHVANHSTNASIKAGSVLLTFGELTDVAPDPAPAEGEGD